MTGRVLTIGDVMLDRRIEGNVSRFFEHAPIFECTSQAAYPGGAANVAANAASLGSDRPVLLGVTGKDEAGDWLASKLAPVFGLFAPLIRSGDRPTTEKTRYIARGRQIMRVDREETHDISPDIAEGVLSAAKYHAPKCGVMVLSDYLKGVLTRGLIAQLIGLAKANAMPVLVDPKGQDFTRYAGATLIKPDAVALGITTGADRFNDASIIAGCRTALELTGADHILATRADKGMILVSRDSAPLVLPATASEAIDPVGAGDTAIAALAVSLGRGDDIETAARFANIAAGIAVGKAGTATVGAHEIGEGRP